VNRVSQGDKAYGEKSAQIQAIDRHRRKDRKGSETGMDLVRSGKAGAAGESRKRALAGGWIVPESRACTVHLQAGLVGRGKDFCLHPLRCQGRVLTGQWPLFPGLLVAGRKH
jgi:hypothetical protein